MESRDFKRGDIVWVYQDYEYNNSVQRGSRPGVIVSNDKNNAYSSTFEVVFLTASPKKDLPTHCKINSAVKPSTAICEQISTVCADDIGNTIGTCTPQEMDMIDICMTISLGLDVPAHAHPKQPEQSPDCAEYDAMKKEYENILVENEKLREQIKLNRNTDFEDAEKWKTRFIESNAKLELIKEMYVKLLEKV